MRSPRCGFITAGLIIGLLCFAPGSSDAGVPKVTIYWGTTAKPVTVSSTNLCSNGEKTAGYTHCYRITPGTITFSPGVSATISDYDSTRIAKVLMADTASNTNVDLLTVSGLIVTPPAQIATCTDTTNSSSCTRLQIMVEAKFDQSNPAGSTYKGGVRLGGSMSANAAVSPFNQNNYVKVEGKALFTTATTPTTVDTRTHKEPSSNLVIASLPSALSTSTYPQFTCNNGSGGCTPTLFTTITWVPRSGQDKLNLPNSGDFGFAGASCNPCLAPPEKVAEKNLKARFSILDKLDNTANQEIGAVSTVPCSEPDCDKDQDPTTSITIKKTIACGGNCSSGGLAGTALLRFTFNIYSEPDGLLIGTAQIEMEGGTGTVSEPYVETREITIPVNAGSYRIQEVANSFWYKDYPTCTSGGSSPGNGITGNFTASATCDFRNTFNLGGGGG